MKHPTSLLLTALAATFLLAKASQAQTIIYQEDFSRPSSQLLDGLQPEPVNTDSATWNTLTWRADGTWQMGNVATALNRMAFLPVSIESDRVYTLTGTLTAVPNSQMYLGFSPSNSTSAGADGTFRMRINYDGTTDLLTRMNGSSEVESSSYAGEAVTFGLTLDTTQTAWVGSFAINGNVVRTEAFGSNPTSLTYVYFGGRRGDTTGNGSDTVVTADDFSLAVIPEPSSFAFLAASLAAMTLLLRRRQS